MVDVIEAFFAPYATPHTAPRLVDLVGSCRLDIEGAGSWIFTIINGVLTVGKSRSDARAESVVRGSQQDFIRMMQRKQNPLTAYLQGRLQVTGDISLAQNCMRIFRIQPQELDAQWKGEQGR